MPINNIKSMTEYKLYLRFNNYIPITNPVSPYRSCIPPTHSCYTPEIPNDYTICFEFSSFKKKTKKETLEIE